MLEEGWLPFKEVFRLQKIFDEEESFFQALSFVTRVQIKQVNQSLPSAE